MERENAQDRYKWDLTKIFNTDKDWEVAFDNIKKQIDKFSKFEGKLNNKEVLLNYFHFSDDFSRAMGKVSLYNFLNHDINLKDSKYIERDNAMNDLGSKLGVITAYIEPELSSLSDDYLVEVMNDERFKNYKLSIQGIRDSKKHVLSKKEEEMAALVGSFSGGYADVYDMLVDANLQYEPVMVDGREEKLTDSSYSNFIKNENREVRKQAYDKLYKVYKQFGDTIATNFIYNLKADSFDLKLRKYDNYLDATLEGSKIPTSVYTNLIKSVNKNVDALQDYFKVLAESKKIKDFSMHDVYCTVANKINKSYTFDQECDIVLEALQVLGPDYLNRMNIMMHNRQIDVYSSDVKASGGYNIGQYGCPEYILLNDNGDYNSLSTLAHELGHAMHSTYSNMHQPISTAGYSIFVAEVASTVNEVLLNKHLYKNAKTIEEKIFYLDKYIQNFKSTLYRQTMFSEFEDYAHKLIENGEPISKEILNKKYLELNAKQFGDAVQLDDNIAHEWMRVSHFYRPYYVYKYATSYTCAVYIANKILEGDKELLGKYQTLLCSGGSDYPNNLLNKVGIHLETEEPYNYVFNELRESVKELKDLVKQRDKQNEVEK